MREHDDPFAELNGESGHAAETARLVRGIIDGTEPVPVTEARLSPECEAELAEMRVAGARRQAAEDAFERRRAEPPDEVWLRRAEHVHQELQDLGQLLGCERLARPPAARRKAAA